MDRNDRPHSRDKEVSSGTAHVGKGKRVDAGGKVGSGSGGMSPGGGRLHKGRSASAGSAVGLLALFLALPKKLRTVLLLLIAAVALFALLNPSQGGEAEQPGGYPDAALTSAPPASAPTSAPAPGPAAATPGPVSSDARSYRVTPLGNGQDTVTVMIYMCGTDLESKYGMGTSDLNEMIKATISDRVNVIVETGGCRQWRNSVVSSRVNEVYKVESGGLRRLEDNFGDSAMTDPANLSKFIRYCAENYPADRNILIFWDHGGGSLSGYGYDEKHASSSSMTLDQINAALAAGGCTFDWIGFDACLMATLETAMVCERYADYMIASEESEPGTGWYYTDWLTQLSRNTSVDTVTLAGTIIDTFVQESCRASARAQVTLSVMDLARLSQRVPAAFRSFSTSTNALVQGDGYRQVSDARSGARQFAQSSRIDQVDLIDLCERLGTGEARTLAGALRDCVRYNNSTVSRANGVSIFFPYESLSSMNSAVSTFNSLGIDSEYTKCIQSFASLGQGGHMVSSASAYGGQYGSYGDLLGTLLGGYEGSSSQSAYGSSPLGSLLGSYTNASGSASSGYSISAADIVGLMSAFSGRSMPRELAWVDTELVASSAGKIAEQSIDPGRITVNDKNGSKVLKLTDEEWERIRAAELNVFVDDGAGYIDLGLDNVLRFDGDGDLLLDFDGSWLTVDGHVCAYYLLSDTEDGNGGYTTVGRIPALLDKGEGAQLVNLQLVFDDENPRGLITGAYPFYEGETDTESKGAIPVEAGDSLQFLCDYYGYDGSYSATYELGEEFTVQELRVTNMMLDGAAYSVTYRLTDLFGNHYWTPAITQ